MHLPLVFTSQYTIPTSLLVLCKPFLFPLLLYFYEVQAGWYKTNCHHPYIDSTVLSMCLSRRIVKCVRIFETFADEKLTNILIAIYNQIKCMLYLCMTSLHDGGVVNDDKSSLILISIVPVLLLCERTSIKFYLENFLTPHMERDSQNIPFADFCCLTKP